MYIYNTSQNHLITTLQCKNFDLLYLSTKSCTITIYSSLKNCIILSPTDFYLLFTFSDLALFRNITLPNNTVLSFYLHSCWSITFIHLHLHINLPLIIEFLPLSSLSNIITLLHCHI
ncbi:hypothetical protein Avbf_13309 [Armadillidium vulgare]|nr:hypothetical protein Avbf_13309 [Armadillidium vulgare]